MTLGTSLKSLISFWASLETSIGAVSRIRSFAEQTPSEDVNKPARIPDSWVQAGGIEIDSVTASHNLESTQVLKDITLSIAPGEHIGICGRSGR